MFTNLCLILLLLLAGSLQFRNFTFNYRKKAKKKSRKSSNTVQLADGVTAVAQLYALYSHRARSFNQWQRALYPNFIITIFIPLSHPHQPSSFFILTCTCKPIKLHTFNQLPYPSSPAFIEYWENPLPYLNGAAVTNFIWTKLTN